MTLTLWATAGLIAPHIQDPEIAWVFHEFSSVNGIIAVLSLLPVQPLEGGKLFEPMMPPPFPALTAFMIAGATGLVRAVAWVPLMLWGFMNCGFILFSIPSIMVQRQILRPARRSWCVAPVHPPGDT